MSAFNRNHVRWGEFDYLQPLCHLAHCLGISPLHKESEWYRYYAMFIMGVVALGSGGSLVARVYVVYGSMRLNLVIINVISLFVLTVANLWAVRNVSLKHKGETARFLFLFAKVDRKLACELIFRSPSVARKFYLEFFLGHILIILYYAYDAYFWIDELSLLFYKTYFFRSLQNYFNFVFALLIRNFVLAVKHRYQRLNRRLMKYGGGKGGIWSVKDFLKIYTTLCEQVLICNKVFGYPILFLSLYFACELLQAIVLFIVYFVGKEVNINGDIFGFKMLVLCSFWTLKDLILFLFIISPCDETTGEAKQTSIICYKLLQELPSSSKGGALQEPSTRDDLILLAIQSSTRYPTFSAAGFFTVDYTMLFTLLGSITSYLVVLIQFN